MKEKVQTKTTENKLKKHSIEKNDKTDHTMLTDKKRLHLKSWYQGLFCNQLIVNGEKDQKIQELSDGSPLAVTLNSTTKTYTRQWCTSRTNAPILPMNSHQLKDILKTKYNCSTTQGHQEKNHKQLTNNQQFWRHLSEKNVRIWKNRNKLWQWNIKHKKRKVLEYLIGSWECSKILRFSTLY